MEEGGEHEFLCGIELCPDQDGLVGLVVPEDDGLHVAIRVQLGPGSRVDGGYLELVLREVLCRLGDEGLVPGPLDGRGGLTFSVLQV